MFIRETCPEVPPELDACTEPVEVKGLVEGFVAGLLLPAPPFLPRIARIVTDFLLHPMAISPQDAVPGVR